MEALSSSFSSSLPLLLHWGRRGRFQEGQRGSERLREAQRGWNKEEGWRNEAEEGNKRAKIALVGPGTHYRANRSLKVI